MGNRSSRKHRDAAEPQHDGQQPQQPQQQQQQQQHQPAPSATGSAGSRGSVTGGGAGATRPQPQMQPQPQPQPHAQQLPQQPQQQQQQQQQLQHPQVPLQHPHEQQRRAPLGMLASPSPSPPLPAPTGPVNAGVLVPGEPLHAAPRVLAPPGAVVQVTAIPEAADPDGRKAFVVNSLHLSGADIAAHVSLSTPRDESLVAWGLPAHGSGGLSRAVHSSKDPLVHMAAGQGGLWLGITRSGSCLGLVGGWPSVREVPGTHKLRVVSVACGSGHSALVTAEGAVFAWGRNDWGQAGQPAANYPEVHAPTELAAFRQEGMHAVQVACGAAHTVALSNTGLVVAFGSNRVGELGTGYVSPFPLHEPQSVRNLWSRPITAVACGATFNVAVTASGLLYSWGGGPLAALGHGQTGYGSIPTPGLVEALIKAKVRVADVACGPSHAVALTDDGRVFFWGDCAALGAPPGAVELDGLPSPAVAVAAGNEMLVAVLRAKEQPHDPHQHDHQQHHPVTSPMVVVVGAHPDPAGLSALVAESISAHAAGSPISAVAVGGHCVYVSRGGHEPERLARERHLEALTVPRIEALLQRGAGGSAELAALVQRALKHPSCVNGSFLSGDALITSTYGGVQLSSVRRSWELISGCQDGRVRTAALNGLAHLCAQLRDMPADTSEVLRALIVLMDCPLLVSELPATKPALALLVRRLVSLPEFAARILHYWLQHYPSEHLERVVVLANAYLSVVLTSEGLGTTANEAFRLIQVLYDLNERANALPFHAFYNREVSAMTRTVLREDYMRWESRTNRFSFCSYPFLLDLYTKSLILKDAALGEMGQVVVENLLQSLYTGAHPTSFVLVVRRSMVVEDSLNNLFRAPPMQLKKPLHVIFDGEEGQDAGGVKKEFFQLVTRELFNPDYGMFTYSQERGFYWFNPDSLETALQFQLVGMLLGLAIYNGVLIPIHFPVCVWKKLLHQPLTLADLIDFDPQLGSSLQNLIEYDGGDEEEVFALDFSVGRNVFGVMQVVELVPGGRQIPVTAANKREYVDRYLRWALDDCVRTQFTAFASGFAKLCSGPYMRLFRPEELQQIIVGSEDLDFRALERNTRYEGGFAPDQRPIRWFWEIVHEMSVEQKRKLLAFSTGSDRAPVLGLADLKFTVQRMSGDTDRLPTSHTCFNSLLLPAYASKEKMRRKLLIAIENSEGFGMR